MNILILLGGGRGNWPNFWSALAYRPEHVYYLPCEGDAANVQFTQEFLTGKGQSHTILPPVPAYDPNPTLRACSDIIRGASDKTVLINMTQSPKLVAFGGAAAQQNRANVSVFFRDTARGRSFFVFGPEIAPVDYSATVDDYLAAYGRTGWQKFSARDYPCPEEDLGKLAQNIAFQIDDYREMMSQLRAQPLGGEMHIRGAQSWRASWPALLNRMGTFGLLTDIAVRANTASFRCANTKVWEFINGVWLELYVRNRARDLKLADGSGRPAFSDCKMSLMIPNHIVENGNRRIENEIDLACLNAAGVLLYASCKTATREELRDLDEIVDRAKLLGGDYCGKMMITSISGANLTPNYLAQAKARHIEVVCAEQLRDLPKHFQNATVTLAEQAR